MATAPYSMYIFVVLFVCVMCEPPTEKKLHNLLLQNYNKLIRPSGVNGSMLTVRLGMRLSQILDISEKNQILTVNVRLWHEWIDSRLRWNKEDYEGIEKTHLPADELWRPDILLYNNADGKFVVSFISTAAVYNDGRILWEPAAIYKSYCPIDVEFFPFDQQECFMKFSSWTYDGTQLDLRHIWEDQGKTINNQIVVPLGVDLCEYYPNIEWDIINVTARRAVKFYPCCLEPWPDLMFNITIRRRTLFYSINLIMPCVAISGLTILVFYLPSHSGEKITLSISIVIALTVFFLLLADINPPTSIVIPLIGKYLLFTMIVVVLSIFLTVYTLSVHFRSPATHSMSPWVKAVFTELLPKVLCVKRPEYDTKKKKKAKALATTDATNVHNDASAEQLDLVRNNDHPNYENLRRRGVSEPVDDLAQYPIELRESLQGVKYIAEHLRNEDEETAESNDWHYVAIVMDRLFLWLFTVACVCGTFGIFMNAPTLYENSRILDKTNFTCN